MSCCLIISAACFSVFYGCAAHQFELTEHRLGLSLFLICPFEIVLKSYFPFALSPTILCTFGLLAILSDAVPSVSCWYMLSVSSKEPELSRELQSMLHCNGHKKQEIVPPNARRRNRMPDSAMEIGKKI